jgi:uncharacterized protein (DUF433 family)
MLKAEGSRFMAIAGQPEIRHIEVRGNRDGQPRAFIAGTRVRVQDIYVDAEIHGLSADEIVDGYPHLTLAQVHAALSYYFDHREAIQEELRQDREFVARVKAHTGRGPLERKWQGANPGDDPISS